MITWASKNILIFYAQCCHLGGECRWMEGTGRVIQEVWGDEWGSHEVGKGALPDFLPISTFVFPVVREMVGIWGRFIAWEYSLTPWSRHPSGSILYLTDSSPQWKPSMGPRPSAEITFSRGRKWEPIKLMFGFANQRHQSWPAHFWAVIFGRRLKDSSHGELFMRMQGIHRHKKQKRCLLVMGKVKGSENWLV